MARNITPRSEDYAQWYIDVIKAAQLADYSPVRGCMVIRPEGYAIWEAIQRDLDRRFKDMGHVNAYFPLLIPQSFLAREAEHIEGFAMECAVVTHSRLEKGDKGLQPAAPLEEPLVIRPTSETVIGHMYAQWVQSYRDLPILINQWCNVMRWELRTRLFLRTAEFLWQEGHTAHETAEEALQETMAMLDVYESFARDVLAIPVVKGAKTDSEKFPGAVTTYAIEGLMQDGRALQCGTSHFLGQNFAKAFEVKFLGRQQELEYAWTTSWGVSTRLIGGMVMAHSDDEGLVLPPRVAPNVVAVVPIYASAEEEREVRGFVHGILEALVGPEEVDAASRRLARGGIESFFFDKHTHQRVVVDWREVRPGDKHYYWEQRGVPFRFEVGPRDVRSNSFVVKRRLDRARETVSRSEISAGWLCAKLDAVHEAMYAKALDFREANTHRVETYADLKSILERKGGFVRCHFIPDPAAEARIKEETKATVRCIPMDQEGRPGTCIYSGQQTDTEVIFAQAY